MNYEAKDINTFVIGDSIKDKLITRNLHDCAAVVMHGSKFTAMIHYNFIIDSEENSVLAKVAKELITRGEDKSKLKVEVFYTFSDNKKFRNIHQKAELNAYNCINLLEEQGFNNIKERKSEYKGREQECIAMNNIAIRKDYSKNIIRSLY